MFNKNTAKKLFVQLFQNPIPASGITESAKKCGYFCSLYFASAAWAFLKSSTTPLMQ